MMTENYNYPQQGWQCPICKRVYSPSTPCCLSCGGESVTFTSNSTGTPYVVPDWNASLRTASTGDNQNESN